MATCTECSTRKALFCAECVDNIMIGHGYLLGERFFQGKLQMMHRLESVRRLEGVTAAVEAARIPGDQYMYMEDKALFDYGVMVGALEYVEKAVTAIEKERVAEL